MINSEIKTRVHTSLGLVVRNIRAKNRCNRSRLLSLGRNRERDTYSTYIHGRNAERSTLKLRFEMAATFQVLSAKGVNLEFGGVEDLFELDVTQKFTHLHATPPVHTTIILIFDFSSSIKTVCQPLNIKQTTLGFYFFNFRLRLPPHCVLIC